MKHSREIVHHSEVDSILEIPLPITFYLYHFVLSFTDQLLKRIVSHEKDKVTTLTQ